MSTATCWPSQARNFFKNKKKVEGKEGNYVDGNIYIYIYIPWKQTGKGNTGKTGKKHTEDRENETKTLGVRSGPPLLPTQKKGIPQMLAVYEPHSLLHTSEAERGVSLSPSLPRSLLR